ncbi:hypothetical protein RB614_10980 [Phytohabitans sp. ZYX-F-186]|uniref:Oligopeptide/dipeptide ABC transporter C-terminal domain-containing protein n=1 Tax=Phytohabitans maris TaxID=3071409 RepID=A0ABU0ZDA8_9ACTN|nr:hypothetical protein [Phytohabitans sp. ZYX-F-186]MDQ7905044.1 hypothetical protein [Phytohabitans sp. ZYX-F-186]
MTAKKRLILFRGSAATAIREGLRIPDNDPASVVPAMAAVTKHLMADEYLDVLYKLWEGSWDDDAILADRDGKVFADPAKIRPIHHKGRWFQVEGPVARLRPRAQVLDLLTDLQDELGVSYLFISHDLGVIHHMSDRILVMKDGKVVEEGTAADVFERPRHPYTRRLLTAVPRLGSA